VSGQLHAPAALPPEETACGAHLIGGWVDPRAGLDDVEKRKFLTLPGLELRTSVFQPVASRYTDYALEESKYGSFINFYLLYFSRNELYEL
jgi:hypothetical protein